MRILQGLYDQALTDTHAVALLCLCRISVMSTLLRPSMMHVIHFRMLFYDTRYILGLVKIELSYLSLGLNGNNDIHGES